MGNLSEGIYRRGYDAGVDRLADYIAKLLQEGKTEEVLKVSTDEKYREMALARFEKEKEEAEKKKREAVTE